MDIDYIREFVVLVQTGSFMKAAEKLFICQSSLSKHIKVLENELGLPLFDRTTRKVTLTDFGNHFLEFANKITQLQNEYHSLAYNTFQMQQNTVTIGSIPVMPQYGITDVILRFKKEHGGITLKLLEGDTLELRELLKAGKIDLAFLRSCGESEDEFFRIRYSDDKLVAVIPSSNPLSQLKSISLSQLRSEDLLMLQKGTMLYDLCVKVCRQEGFEPRVAYTSHRAENAIDLVEKGMGIALIMEKLVSSANRSNIAIVEVEPLICTEVCLCYIKEKELSPAAKHFIRHVAMMGSKNPNHASGDILPSSPK